MLFSRISGQQALSQFFSCLRPTDTFLVSCPKSGTTWLTFLIINAIFGDAASHLCLKNSHEYIPDINRLFKGQKSFSPKMLQTWTALPNPRIFRVHAPYDDRFPQIIYLLRDPRDVILSQWHYLRGIRKDFRQNLLDFIKTSSVGIPWEVSVDQWLLPEPKGNILVVRYEELSKRPASTLESVLDHLGVRCDRSTISASVEESSLEKMKRLEGRHGSAERFVRADERFVRRGKPGGWRDEMTEAEKAAALSRFGNILARVGYDE